MRHSLHRLTVVVLVAAFLTLAVGQYAAARWWYGTTFDTAEHNEAVGRARLAERMLAEQRENLRRAAREEAVWDDAFRYMRGENPKFFDDIWNADFFINLPIDMVAFVAPDGHVVAQRAFYPATNQLGLPPPDLALALAPGGSIASRVATAEFATGLALVGGTIYAFGTSPILPSSGSGPPMGEAYLFRAIGKPFQSQMSELAGARASLTVIADPLSGGGTEVRIDDSDKELLGIHFLAGHLGSGHSAEVELISPRPVHAGALRAARALLWSTLVAGVILVLLAFLVFSRRLLQPLHAMAKRLAEIGRAGDPSARLPQPKHADEIGIVTNAANQMLAELEEAKRNADSARDAALAASRIKSEFLARMSHEIRTPMNGVLGMSELLGRSELSVRQRRFSDTIHRSAVALLEIINDILDFSKIEAKRLELAPINADLGSLVEESLELLSPRAHARGLELIVEIRPAVPPVVTLDPVRLGQVLNNLVGNAVKFTERGEVIVTVDARALADSTAELEFTVADTGIGIEPEALARIFEPFGQADASTTRRFGGTGLGLAIARQLVELMGGELKVASTAGKGSSFTFTIRAGAPPQPPAPKRPPLLRGISILVADDNRALCGVLGRYLTAAGARVFSVGAAGAELKAVAAELAGSALDFAVIDSALRAPHGRGISDVLATDLAFKGVRIIAMTAAADPSADSDSGSSVAIAGYLTKPIRRSLLFAMLGRLAGRGPELDTGSFLASFGLSAAAERLQLHVLVAEDNPVNQAVAVGMLEALGCYVELAAHGGEALERLVAGGIDVVLMDCQMPVMDGIEATERIRAAEAQRHGTRIPIVGVSAHALAGAREECLRAGMSDFVAKPFTMAELARALRRHVKRRTPELDGPGPARPTPV